MLTEHDRKMNDGWYDVWETRRVYPPYEWTLLTSLGTKQAADDFVLSRMTNNCLDRRMVFYRVLPAGSPPPEADPS